MKPMTMRTTMMMKPMMLITKTMMKDGDRTRNIDDSSEDNWGVIPYCDDGALI